MKNFLLVLLTFMLTITSFISCGELKSSDPREIVVTTKNNSGEKRSVKFWISPEIDKDSIPRSSLVYMTNSAVRYADWGAKHKLTYDFNESGSNFISSDSCCYRFSISGKASNSFGVPGKITTIIKFDKKSMKMIEDKNGLPDIISF